LASALALIAVVAGGLLVLLHWGRLDALAAVDWRGVWMHPDDGSLLLGILTVAGWLAWLLVVGTVICEAVAALSRGRLNPRMPGSGWLRGSVASLVVTLLGLSVASTFLGHQSLGAAVNGLDGGTSPAVTMSTQDLLGVRAGASTEATVPYVVQPGDDLWSLAERFAGGGENWRVIAAANDTVVLDPGLELTPGTMLMVPGGVPGGVPVSSQSPSAVTLRADEPVDLGAGVDASTVTVERGDTLWGLSQENLGDGQRWPELYDANRASIGDPNIIFPGQTLVVPDVYVDETGDQDVATLVDVTDDVPTGTPQVSPETPQVPSEMPVPAGDPADEADVDTLDQFGVVLSDAAQMGAGTGEVLVATAAPSVPVSDPGGTPVDDVERNPESVVASLLGSIGVGLAATLVVGLGASRVMQLRERGVGRTLPRLTPGMQELETALDKRARVLLGRPDDDDDDGDDDAERVRPAAAANQRDEDDVDTVRFGSLRLVDGPETDMASVGATVNLGVTADGEDVSLNLVDAGLLQILGPESQASGLMAAMAGQVLAVPVEKRPEVMMAASNLGWLASLLDCPLMPAAIAESLVSARLSAPGLATEQLVVFTDGYLPPVGIGSGITVVSSWCVDRAPDADLAIEIDDVDEARLWQAGVGAGPVFQAQLVSAPARRTLVELVDAVTSLEFPKASWWAPDDVGGAGGGVCVPIDGADSRASIDIARLDTSPDVFALDEALTHPVLRLFGTVELTGTRGVAPTQATKQCLEYCGWLLRNPGQTSDTMAKALLIAEATRRSNMSRLRLWLGCDDAGDPYLPDAYSGRIMLHDGVTSDWDRMNALVGVVNRASEHSLIDALRLVRGAPLADAAPGQWRWAEEWRCDMISLARDIAVVLCERALTRDDVELARWAVARGLLAAPADVLLLTAQVRVEMAAGNQSEVEQLAVSLTRLASRSGFDLPDETAFVLQEALEGTPRLRVAA